MKRHSPFVVVAGERVTAWGRFTAGVWLVTHAAVAIVLLPVFVVAWLFAGKPRKPQPDPEFGRDEEPISGTYGGWTLRRH